MNLLLIGVAGVIGFFIGFIAGVLQVKEVREVDEIAHVNLIKRKNAEIQRLTKCVNELQAKNVAQINAFDRINGFDNDYFKKF